MPNKLYSFSITKTYPADSEEEAVEYLRQDLADATGTIDADDFDCEELIRNDQTEWLFRSFSIEKEKELTDQQLAQIDTVHNLAYFATLRILGIEDDSLLPWDMEWIGEVSDVLVDAICKQFGKSEQEIYPSIERS